MRKLKIEFTKSKNYTTTLATGVTGGISPTGLVHCEFFAEKANILEDFELQIDEKGLPIEEPRLINKMTRELQTSFLLSPEVAKNIGEWLIRTAEGAESAKKIRDGN